MTLMLLGDLALAFAGFYGRFRLSHGMGSEGYHFLTGLFAAFLSVFAHCMTLFFFIGTGRMIREAVEEHRLDETHNEPPKRFKRLHFPLASVTITATIAVPILGGAVHAGRMPREAHLWVAVSALGLNLAATAVACRLIWLNQALIAKVESEIPA